MVMNAEFLAVLEFWEREKGISKDVLLAAVEEALLSAAKKADGPARELRVAIDQKNGDIRAFAKLLVSEKVASKHDQISLFDARRIKADAQLGEELEVEVTPAKDGDVVSVRLSGESGAGSGCAWTMQRRDTALVMAI